MANTTVRYAAPGWGVGELWLDDDRLLEHSLPVPRNGGPSAPPHELAERFVRYFAGDRVTFDDVQLDLEWCTPFQRALAKTLRNVHRGEVVTYGELAALAGRPGAARAAGSFCAANRFGLVIPCHRVVAADGIGLYGSFGTAYKRRLLELEGVAL